MKATIKTARWTTNHDARFGAPAGVDYHYAEFVKVNYGGRDYINETRTMNNVVVFAANYPADTDYARERLASV